ncbi:hypothetical protein MPSEU_000923900 [Mayamaea pseudoterrestris]|nr:hypothetical protein MPSEU_000923900 [Mayamaea pseudoterrestris]
MTSTIMAETKGNESGSSEADSVLNEGGGKSEEEEELIVSLSALVVNEIEAEAGVASMSDGMEDSRSGAGINLDERAGTGPFVSKDGAEASTVPISRKHTMSSLELAKATSNEADLDAVSTLRLKKLKVTNAEKVQANEDAPGTVLPPSSLSSVTPLATYFDVFDSADYKDILNLINSGDFEEAKSKTKNAIIHKLEQQPSGDHESLAPLYDLYGTALVLAV